MVEYAFDVRLLIVMVDSLLLAGLSVELGQIIHVAGRLPLYFVNEVILPLRHFHGFFSQGP